MTDQTQIETGDDPADSQIDEDIPETTIKCDRDECGWEKLIKWQEVPEWHMKPCPECEKSIIIGDFDLNMWKGANAMIVSGLIRKAKPGEKADPDGDEIIVQMDTAQIKQTLSN